jgi:hypothetical protein
MATTTKRASIWNTNAGAKVTAAFTPAANDLLIAITGHSNTDTADTVTDSQGGSWDLVGTFRSHSTAVAGGLRIWARTAAVSASSMTVTSTPGGTSTGGGLAVLSVSGSSGYGSGAIRAQGGLADQAAGTPSVVLPQAALTTSSLIGAVMTNTNGSANCAIPSGWAVEDYDQGYATPATGLEVCHRDTGETRTTIPFGAATPSQFAAIIIEILPAASTADLTVTLYQGGTAKASKVITGITSSSFIDDEFVLTGGEADSITDYNDLRIGFKATATGGGRVDVSWAEVETPGAPPSALVPALTVAVVVAIPAPTVNATARTTVGTVAGSTTAPAATLRGTAIATPATVGVIAAIGAAQARGAAVAIVAAFPYYGDQYGEGSAAISIVVLIATPSLNPAAVPLDETGSGIFGSSAPFVTEIGLRAFASVDEFGQRLFGVTGVTGAAVATPATVGAVASVPTPAILVPNVLVSAVRALALATVPGPTIGASAIAAPSTAAAVAAIPAPTVRGVASMAPATVAGATTVPAVTAQGAARPTPATVAAIATVPAPTVRGTAIATPATVQAFAAVPAPTIPGPFVLPNYAIFGETERPDRWDATERPGRWMAVDRPGRWDATERPDFWHLTVRPSRLGETERPSFWAVTIFAREDRDVALTLVAYGPFTENEVPEALLIRVMKPLRAGGTAPMSLFAQTPAYVATVAIKNPASVIVTRTADILDPATLPTLYPDDFSASELGWVRVVFQPTDFNDGAGAYEIQVVLDNGVVVLKSTDVWQANVNVGPASAVT